MQVIVVVLALVAVASAGVVSPLVYSSPSIISRAPQFDSAVIKSDRVGGNFAYSVAENHAFAQHTPIVQHITSPVGVSYAAGAPVVTGYSAPAYATVAHAHHAAPIAYSAGLPLGFGGVVRAW